ncbi:hypothetical protein HN415_01240, partial [Candidatus Woesearchaeota archaeon]|nr:hypothetical protein [Candidatus Woesearchaeota archaeon]
MKDNKLIKLLILILIVIFYLNSCSYINVYDNPIEKYSEYIIKKNNLEEYKIIYNTKFKFFSSDYNYDSNLKVGIFKKKVNEKIVLESNVNDFNPTIYYYFYNKTNNLSCIHSGDISTIKCEELNFDKQRLINFLKPDNFYSNFSNLDANIIYNGTIKILNRKCDQFNIEIINVSNYYENNNNFNEFLQYLQLEQDMNQIQISTCIDRKTGLPLNFNLFLNIESESLEIETKLKLIEFNVIEFRKLVPDKEFIFPINFSIIKNYHNNEDFSILVQSYDYINGHARITINKKDDNKVIEKFDFGNVNFKIFDKEIFNLNTRLNLRNYNNYFCINNECNLINRYSSININKFECFKKSLDIDYCNSDLKCEYNEKICTDILCWKFSNESDCIKNELCKWHSFNSYGDFMCTKRTCDDFTNKDSCEELSNNCLWGNNSCIIDNCLYSKSKAYCYSNLAFKYENILYCNRIKNEGDKHRCIEKFAEKSLNSTSCFNITMELRKDNCLKSVAEKTGDSSLCLKINSTSVRNGCYKSVAKKNNDVKLCEFIVPYYTTSIKQDCYSFFSDNNNDLCQKLDDDYDKFKCYLGVAEKTNNEESCEKIDFEVNENCNHYIPENEECRKNQLLGDIESKCWTFIAIEMNDGEYCNQINKKNTKGIAYCLTKTAKIHNNISICYEFENDAEKETCISRIAKNSKNLSICNYNFTYPKHYNSCIFSIAQNNDDELICEKISDIKMREECLR